MAQEKQYVYAEAFNGMTVRVPVDKYEAWEKQQEAYRKGEKKADPKVVEEILSKLRGK